MNQPLLEARGLTIGYGSMPVVRQIDLHVQRGEVVALLGPNGAGKTTTLSALSGALPPMHGEISLHGTPATKTPLHKRARAGLGYVSEQRSIFTQLSVAANLKVARCDPEETLKLFPELLPMLDRKGALLSGGEQQMLALARALGRRPTVLLADELSLGLAPMVVDRLLEALVNAAREGTGILLVEQHIRKALAVCDRAYVMQQGQLVLEGSAADLEHRAEEIEVSYFGGPSVAAQPNGTNGS
jgi:branched-chain amino acid transport system ATP-binding protein